MIYAYKTQDIASCKTLGSKDELEDLETAYVEFKGDMSEIIYFFVRI